MIYLIRHGETPSNAVRRIQFPDTPLSERGQAQALRLGERLRNSGVTRILSSDYERAHATARAVQATTGVELMIDENLRERNYGDLRGQSYADLGFDPHAPDYEPPNGESWGVFHARVDRAFERIRHEAGNVDGSLAVVTHGLVCFSLASRHLQIGTDAAPMGFGNTSVTTIEPQAPWRVDRLNCSQHLDANTREDREAISGL